MYTGVNFTVGETIKYTHTVAPNGRGTSSSREDEIEVPPPLYLAIERETRPDDFNLFSTSENHLASNELRDCRRKDKVYKVSSYFRVKSRRNSIQRSVGGSKIRRYETRLLCTREEARAQRVRALLVRSFSIYTPTTLVFAVRSPLSYNARVYRFGAELGTRKEQPRSANERFRVHGSVARKDETSKTLSRR